MVELLQSLGWSIVARNWRAPGGELDIILRRGLEVRFVEVKHRQQQDMLADEALSAAQRSRLIRTANLWLSQQTEPLEAAFMVIFEDSKGQVRIIDNAFDAP